MVSVAMKLTADPESCEVQHIPQILDWIEILCQALQTIHEQILQCGMVHYPAERAHCH